MFAVVFAVGFGYAVLAGRLSLGLGLPVVVVSTRRYILVGIGP